MTTGSEYPGGYEGASPRVPEPSPEKRGIGEFSDSRDRPVGGQTFEMRSDAIFVQHPVGSPSRRVLCFLFVLLAAGPVPFAGRATAENDGNRRPGAGLDARQRQIVSSIETTLRQAGTEFRSGQYEESGDSVRRALRQIDAAANVITPQLHEALGPILDRIETAHVLLELEGVSLPPFRRPPVPASRAGFVATAPGESGADAADTDEMGADASQDEPMDRDGGSGQNGETGQNVETGPTIPGETVSFVSRVAPILAQRCGQCHLRQARGDFSIRSYADLMRGTPAGVVVFPGDVVASRLIETIETGDMPRGGGSVPADELAVLRQWVADGADFDGRNVNAPLTTLAAGSPGRARDPSAGRPAAGRSVSAPTVSFAGDVAPLLVENCGGCHIDAAQTRGGLRMDTFAQLMRGGDSGAVIDPGNGAASLLVQKLRGESGQRMPAGGRPPLADDEIVLIATWIDEGAVSDGTDDAQTLAVMSQLAWAASATVEEKNSRRQELAGRALRLAFGRDRPGAETVSEHFLVVSGEAAEVERIAEAAESQLKTIRRQLGGPTGPERFGGRVTIFVLPRRYDYSEFAKMVEGRGVPGDWLAHWRFDGIDAYVAVVVEGDEDRKQIGERLLGPLASLSVATRGPQIPRWFSEGIGSALRHRASPPGDRSERQRFEASTREALAATDSGKTFVEGRLTPAQTDRIGMLVASTLIERSRRRNLDQLLQGLGQGVPFEDAFIASFGLSPADFVDRWLGRKPSGK